MANLSFAENFYSFRYTERVFDAILKPLASEEVPLAAIEAKLVAAHSAYLGRHYQTAIGLYREAEALAYAQLNPNVPYGSRWLEAVPKLALSRDRKLFDPLLGASLEWANLLTVRQPVPTARPRNPVDPGLLNDTKALEPVGLLSARVQPGKTMSAAADLQLANSLTSQGNAAAGKFFANRARQTDPDLVGLLQGHGEPPGPGALAGPAALAGRAVARVVPAGGEGVIASAELGAPLLDLPAALTEARSFGTLLGGRAASFRWEAGSLPPLAEVRKNLYEARVGQKDLLALAMRPIQGLDVALRLPHDYYYVIPLGLAECYHALGQYDAAESLYFQAAGYEFLNAEVEAPYLWIRLATLYLDWGDSLFRQDQAADALPIYQRVLMPNDTAPTSALYTSPALKPGADVARAVIANLASPGALNVNPSIVAAIFEARQQILKINGGLDFWGHWHNTVPIWTFEFLQSAAINFTQLAIGAERDFISFQERADQATLTRQQLADNAAQALAEVTAVQMQADAAKAEVDVYKAGKALADLRAQNAQQNAQDYANMSADEIVRRAVASQLSGGDDGDPNDLNSRADTLMGIGPTAQYIREHPGDWRMVGSAATLSATEQLVAARLNRQYEIDVMKRQAGEMAQAAVQAQAELTAATARQNAAAAAVQVAKSRAQAARNELNAFDNQFFTPDVWDRMADRMRRLYRRYLTMALRTAKLMQQAYNFENDQALHLIKSDYSTDEVKGLLAADALMADIQSFTFDLITTQTNKPQPIRQTISLAERYGFAFETQFRKTGAMDFQTTIDDFDTVYPGTYAGRIEAVEVEVSGIVPPVSMSGTLTNSGISSYRLPGAAWTNPADPGLKFRVQSKETLVLSDYATRLDAPLVPGDARQRKIFQGAGVVSTWRLELPKAVNDIDYGALTDVRLTFYYKARFDPDLRDRVLAQLATRPALSAGQRALPLRWLFPDAFFHFQDTGTLTVTLGPKDFRHNQTKPALTSVGVLLVTDGSVPAGGVTLSLSTPTKAAVKAKTDATGAISSTTTAAWGPLVGATALGDYVLTLAAADNPALVKNNKLTLTPIANIALILGFTFTPRA
jgi:hypothetical protein